MSRMRVVVESHSQFRVRLIGLRGHRHDISIVYFEFRMITFTIVHMSLFSIILTFVYL